MKLSCVRIGPFTSDAHNALKKCALDKDAAIVVAEALRKNEKFEELGQGEWQCIIGKKFSASLTYDTGVLFFFDLTKHFKSVLVFKSG